MSSAQDSRARPAGRVVPAPENHLADEIVQHARGRRRFARGVRSSLTERLRA